MRSIRDWRAGSLVQHRTRALVALIGAGAIVTLGATAVPATAAPGGSRLAQPRAIRHGVAVHMTKVGTVNFGALARAARPRAARSLGTPHAMPLRLPSFVRNASARAARPHVMIPHVARATRFAGNVRGQRGFNGIDHTANENNFGFDISPPDHALAVGTSSAGPIIIQSLNLSLQAFTRSGHPLTPPVGANTFMGLGPCTGNNFPVNCPSDPRVYWDPQTRHWFITDFTFANVPLGEQFIAVSRTTNGLGNYTIFSIPTGAGFIDPSDCPCTGDFDMIGADNNGFYLDVNEFGQTSYHGADLFAVSKRGLIAAANGGTATVFLYTVPTQSDPFGGFRLAPASTTQGSRFPNTEYFVENDGNLFSNTSLEVWALLHTALAERHVPDRTAAGRDERGNRGLQHPAASDTEVRADPVRELGRRARCAASGQRVRDPAGSDLRQRQPVRPDGYRHQGRRRCLPIRAGVDRPAPQAGHVLDLCQEGEQRLRRGQRAIGVPVNRGQRQRRRLDGFHGRRGQPLPERGLHQVQRCQGCGGPDSHR